MLLIVLLGITIMGLSSKSLPVSCVGLVGLMFYIFPAQTSLALASFISAYYIKDYYEL